jgi:RNA-directed DNA polymerase
LLANIYLNPLDHLMAENGCEMVRYADDFVILCRSREAAEAALARVRTWVVENGLKLHPEKTRIVDATQRGGFDFLGYHFERGYRWPRKKSRDKLEQSIRELTPRRTCGCSLEQCIASLNEVLKGWYGYFKQSHKTAFGDVDQYVRGRLRSILRNREGRRGRGRGKDHQRWPNHYFAKLGLFSLRQAHASPPQTRTSAINAYAGPGIVTHPALQLVSGSCTETDQRFRAARQTRAATTRPFSSDQRISG